MYGMSSSNNNNNYECHKSDDDRKEKAEEEEDVSIDDVFEKIDNLLECRVVSMENINEVVSGLVFNGDDYRRWTTRVHNNEKRHRLKATFEWLFSRNASYPPLLTPERLLIAFPDQVTLTIVDPWFYYLGFCDTREKLLVNPAAISVYVRLRKDGFMDEQTMNRLILMNLLIAEKMLGGRGTKWVVEQKAVNRMKVLVDVSPATVVTYRRELFDDQRVVTMKTLRELDVICEKIVGVSALATFHLYRVDPVAGIVSL